MSQEQTGMDKAGSFGVFAAGGAVGLLIGLVIGSIVGSIFSRSIIAALRSLRRRGGEDEPRFEYLTQ
jgi:hypothetical protein